MAATRPIIQAKLHIGQPGDKYEREADAVADKVMRLPSGNHSSFEGGQRGMYSRVQRKPLVSEITGKVQRKEEAEELIQPKAENAPQSSSSSLESQLSSTKGRGSPLPEGTRSFMESGIGADFSNVKVHTDSKAVQMSQELGAQAFTHGNDVYFNSGKYSPESSGGKHLLAHELAHTVQQGDTLSHGISRSNINLQRKHILDEEGDRTWYRYKNRSYQFYQEGWRIATGDRLERAKYVIGKYNKKKLQEASSEEESEVLSAELSTLSTINNWIGPGFNFKDWQLNSLLKEGKFKAKYKGKTYVWKVEFKGNRVIKNNLIKSEKFRYIKNAKFFKVMGSITNIAGGVISFMQWQEEEIGTPELVLDLTFSAVAFVPPYGWIVSGVYFLGKDMGKEFVEFLEAKETKESIRTTKKLLNNDWRTWSWFLRYLQSR